MAVRKNETGAKSKLDHGVGKITAVAKLLDPVAKSSGLRSAAPREPASSRTPRASVAKALERIRKICLALPRATERLSHGSPTFFIGKAPSFVMFMTDHHGDGRLAIWCAAPPGAQEVLIASDPERFFYPAYVGHRGWVGARLDRMPDWQHVAAVIEDAYWAVAPAKIRRER